MLIQKGNVEASNELFKRYDRYSWRIAYDFHYAHPRSGIGVEEYHQVAFSSIVMALKKYMLEKRNTFYAFYKKIAENDVLRYYLDNSYQAGASAFSGISLSNANDDGYELSDHIGKEDEGIHESIRKQELNLYVEEVKQSFKDKNDRLIINLFLKGHTFDFIVKVRESNYRHVTYVIARFQKSMSKILQKRNYN